MASRHVAFQAFRTYAELGPGRRLVDVSRQLSKSVVLMQRWSKRWSWQARVAAWGSAQWQRDAEAKHDPHLRWAHADRCTVHNAGILRSKASQRLDKPLSASRRLESLRPS